MFFYSLGPCILLGRKSRSGKVIDRKFVCAVFRKGECDFSCPVAEDGSLTVPEASVSTVDSGGLKKSAPFRKIYKRFLLSFEMRLSSNSVLSCVLRELSIKEQNFCVMPVYDT